MAIIKKDKLQVLLKIWRKGKPHVLMMERSSAEHYGEKKKKEHYGKEYGGSSKK